MTKFTVYLAVPFAAVLTDVAGVASKVSAVVIVVAMGSWLPAKGTGTQCSRWGNWGWC